MRLFGSILRTAGLAVCLAGCAEASLQVVRSNQAPTPIDRLFVAVAQGPFDQSYAEEMSDALVTALCGHVDVRRGPVLTGLELDDSVMSERLRAAGADGLLLLNPIGGTVGGYRNDAPKIVYEATLLHIRSDKVIWGAMLRHEGEPLFLGKRTRLAAERVLAALVQQNIVGAGHGCGPQS